MIVCCILLDIKKLKSTEREFLIGDKCRQLNIMFKNGGAYLTISLSNIQNISLWVDGLPKYEPLNHDVLLRRRTKDNIGAVATKTTDSQNWKFSGKGNIFFDQDDTVCFSFLRGTMSWAIFWVNKGKWFGHGGEKLWSACGPGFESNQATKLDSLPKYLPITNNLKYYCLPCFEVTKHFYISMSWYQES